MKIRDTEIRFAQGDITQMETEGIVFSSQLNERMMITLARSIKEKISKKIQDELMARGPVNVGDVVWTPAGNLKAKSLIHSAVVDGSKNTNEAILRLACMNILKCADELKLGSLSLPALGCHHAKFPVIGSAKIMIQELMKYLRSHSTSLRTITFCLDNKKNYRIFEQTVSGYATHIKDHLGEGPYVTVDIIIEMKHGIVLIERSNPPYGWALPGGFVDYGESVEQAAKREAKEETHLNLMDMRQFHVYSSPDRDPRFHTVSIAFVAKGKGRPQSGDDAKDFRIVPYKDLLKEEYAFDHRQVISDYLKTKGLG